MRVFKLILTIRRKADGDFSASNNCLKVLESELQSGKDTDLSREKQGDGLYDQPLKPCYTHPILLRDSR